MNFSAYLICITTFFLADVLIIYISTSAIYYYNYSYYYSNFNIKEKFIISTLSPQTSNIKTQSKSLVLIHWKRKLIMKTFQTAISPLLIVLCLCGLGVFEHHGQPRLYLTIFYILISWLIYIYIIIKVRLFLQRFTIMLPMSIVTSIVFAVLNIHLNLFYNKVW